MAMAPDALDRAAAPSVVAVWRTRRAAWRSRATRAAWLRWTAPAVLAALALVVAIAWPTSVVVDGDALAGGYFEAMGALPEGAP